MPELATATTKRGGFRWSDAVFTAAMPAVLPTSVALGVASSRLASPSIFMVGVAFVPVGILSTGAFWSLLLSREEKAKRGHWTPPTLHRSFRLARWTWSASAFVSFAFLPLMWSTEVQLRYIATATFTGALVWIGFHVSFRELEKEKATLQRTFPIPLHETVERLRPLVQAGSVRVLKETRHPFTKRLHSVRLEAGSTKLELRGVSRTVAVIHTVEHGTAERLVALALEEPAV